MDVLALFLGSVCTVWPGSEIAPRSLPELDAEGRPILTGAELTHATADGRFLIHYTQAGADSAGDDAKAAELLSWAEEGFSRTWAAFVDEDGWIPPHPDGTIGGDARLDVYVRALDNNGYAHAQSVAGKQACWIELDPATRAFGQETFASIAGHELHHCLQFTVANSRVGGAFLYEGTATWAQYLLFKGDPTIDLARQVLWQIRLGSSARPLFATGDRFEYAGMLWFKFLLDHGARAGLGSDRRKILDLWTAMAAESSAIVGHDVVLPSLFGLADLDAAAARFAEWNWFACLRDDGRHWDPTTLACGLDFAVGGQAATTFPASGTSEAVGRWGSAYVAFTPDCSSADLTVTVTPVGGMRVQLLEVGAGEASPVTERALAPGEATTFVIDGWNRRKRIVLIGTNVGDTDTTFAWQASTAGTYVAPAVSPPIARLRIDPSDRVTLAPGEQASRRAMAGYDTCAADRDVTADVTWQSTDPGMVSVTGGVIRAHDEGVAEVFALAPGNVGSTRVTVEVIGQPGGCAVARTRSDGLWLLALLLLLYRRR